jgi:predicted DNA-binding protein (UPF0251 family)
MLWEIQMSDYDYSYDSGGSSMSTSSSWAGHYTVDPSEMEARFSNEDGMSSLDSISEEPTEMDLGQLQKVREILALLPPREADFVELYYFKKLRQTDIAEIFGVSQPTVCYRLARAVARIRFLLGLPDNIEVSSMEADLSSLLTDPLDVQILLLMWQTTCQSEVAKRLGVSQGLVRHRFLRAISRMRGNPRYENYARLFEYISVNLNILREVQRTMFDDRVTHCIA